MLFEAIRYIVPEGVYVWRPQILTTNDTINTEFRSSSTQSVFVVNMITRECIVIDQLSNENNVVKINNNGRGLGSVPDANHAQLIELLCKI